MLVIKMENYVVVDSLGTSPVPFLREAGLEGRINN